MPTRDEPWPQGTPCWTDLATTDRDAAFAFYRDVLGWEIEDQGPDYGDYGIAQVAGRPVAGIGPKQPGQESMPVAWLTYLAVDDVDAAATAIAEHGGTVLFPPFDVGPMGRMLVALDPSGAAFGLWQAGTSIGAGRVDEPGTMVWNELMSRDAAAARDFYATVLGYTYTALPGLDYTTIDGGTANRARGGIGAIDPSAAATVPSTWMVYFQVADTDTTVAKLRQAGGTVLVAPFDAAPGRIAIVQDPQGAAFALLQIPEGGETGAGTNAQAQPG
jgi:predicted enzyme related to lactoylglutathione lyase